jgi:uncharacterized protein YdaU (DUF1376 family)
MAEFPALNFYTDAFLADTLHLGALETGAYVALLFASWRTEDGGLADDDVKLARMARCSKGEWRRIRPTVMAFWTMCQDGMFRQKRLEIERQAAREKSQSAARSAKARWLKDNKTTNADASETHMRNACETDATTSTSTSIEEVDRPSPEPTREDEPDDWPAENQDGRAVLTRQPSDHRSGGQRYAGDVLDRFLVQTGPVEKRKKLQSRADQDMVRHLTSQGGMDTAKAWAVVMAARDEDDPAHTDAARLCEKASRQHKLGWFAEENA